MGSGALDGGSVAKWSWPLIEQGQPWARREPRSQAGEGRPPSPLVLTLTPTPVKCPTALSFQKGKIKKSSQPFPLPYACQGMLPTVRVLPCVFPSVSSWERNFFGQTRHQCRQQVKSLCGHFSTSSPHPPPGGDGKVQSTTNINMNKKCT